MSKKEVIVEKDDWKLEKEDNNYILTSGCYKINYEDFTTLKQSQEMDLCLHMGDNRFVSISVEPIPKVVLREMFERSLSDPEAWKSQGSKPNYIPDNAVI